MIELQVKKRYLEVNLTEKECGERAEQAAEAAALADQHTRIANQAAEQAKSMKKSAELKTVEAAKLLAIYRAKKEEQLVDTREEYHEVSGDVVVVRLDTQQIVETRKPNEQDLQIIAAKRQSSLDFRTNRPKRRGADAQDGGLDTEPVPS